MEAIKESLAELSQTFHQRFAEFENRQQKMSPSSSEASSLSAEFSSFKSFTLTALRTLQTQVELMACKTDNLEMHSRRKILLLHGVAEDPKEDTVAISCQTVVQRLKLSDFKVADISRCHRMGKSSSDRPRPILIKIRDLSLRSKLWSAKTNLKGSGITMSEFLTKARHDTFMAARQRFGVSKCWTRDGYVYVLGADGVRHRVSCVAELDNIVVPAAAASAAVKPKQASAPAKEQAAAVKPRRATAKK